MIKGWAMATLTPEQKAELVTLASRRRTASQQFYGSRLNDFLKYFKIYRSIKDIVDDEDESNTGPAYAFGIIEDGTAAISESILNTRVPTPARARHAKDVKATENFNAMAATYFACGQYQSDYPQSVRERLIAGVSWEFDGWANEYSDGQAWEKQNTVDETGNPVTLTVAVPKKTPVRTGYFTRFPNVFLMRPQPRVSSVEKMTWLIEIEERVPLEHLKGQQSTDPKTGRLVPFFDLREIEAFVTGGGSVRPEPINDTGSDYMQEYREIQEGSAGNKTYDLEGSQPAELTIEWCWEQDRLFVIANKKWIIAYVEKPLHRPGIPYRIKFCTPQKDSLYGALGMIEPVEGLLYELDDIHVLSMRQWMRIIHRMVAYNPEAVKFPSDFQRRADGKIRVTPPLGGSIQSHIMPLTQENVTREMLAAESNNKGLVERALGMPDFSQGVEGTKQDHDTLGGLQEIKAQAAKRVASIRRQELAGFQKQMWRMEGYFLQFQFDKAPFFYHGPDGSTAMLELDLWDIDTGGRGFDFPIVYDPAFGDDALTRNQKMVLFELAIKYNEATMTQFPPGSKPLAQLDVIFGDTLKPFGYNDTSQVLKNPDGSMTPEQKLQAMLQGQPVSITPNEDLVACYAYLAAQLVNPKLAQAAETGQAPPDIFIRIQTHVKMLGDAIMMALKNPQMVTNAKAAAMPGQRPAPGGPDSGGNVAPKDRSDKGQPKTSPSVPSR